MKDEAMLSLSNESRSYDLRLDAEVDDLSSVESKGLSCWSQEVKVHSL